MNDKQDPRFEEALWYWSRNPDTNLLLVGEWRDGHYCTAALTEGDHCLDRWFLYIDGKKVE